MSTRESLEALREALARVELMASGDPQWDLSNNDRRALKITLQALAASAEPASTPAPKWDGQEQFQRGRLFGQGEGIEMAAQKAEKVMEHSPQHDRELIVREIRTLVVAAQPAPQPAPQSGVPYKGPINQPCSACSAGDTAMEYHDHDYVKPENRRPARITPKEKP